MDRGHVTFKFGGVTRKCPITIGLGLRIEEETNQGLVLLARNLRDSEVRLADAAVIVRLALDDAGESYADTQEFWDCVSKDGILATIASAATIVAALFKTPKRVGKSAGKERAATA